MPTSFPDSGRAPWAAARVTYAGWIPNVLGHLSFSLVGLKGRWANSNALNHTLDLDGTRSIAVRRDRIAQDYPFFDWIVRWRRPAAEQSYLMVARTRAAQIPYVREGISVAEDQVERLRIFDDAQGMLCGTVFVTPRNRNKKYAKARKRAIAKIDELIAKPTSDVIDICQQASEAISSDDDGGFPSIPYRFALFRTGEIRIWLDDAKLNACWLDRTDSRIAIENIFPKQVYYFLKDSLHTHYHHEPDSDQLLPLTKLSQNESGDEAIEKENEVSWRRETLWGLARVVSSFRRSNRIRGLRRAQGVLAYADAFQATVARIYRPSLLSEKPRIDDDLTTYDFAHTRQSVAALEGIRNWWNNGSVQILAGLTALMLAAFTIWSTGLRYRLVQCAPQQGKAGELRDNCSSEISPRADYVLALIVDHPLVFSGLLFVSASLLYQTVVRDIDYGPILGRFTRFLSAFANAIGASLARRMASPFFGFLATSVVLLTIAGLLFAAFAGLAIIMKIR